MVTEEYSKCLTPASPGHSNQNRHQSRVLTLIQQVLTLRLLDTGDSEGSSVDIKEAVAVNRGSG